MEKKSTEKKSTRKELKTIGELKQLLQDLLDEYRNHNINKNVMKKSLENIRQDYNGEEPFWVDRILKQALDGEIPLIECIEQIRKLEFTLGRGT